MKLKLVTKLKQQNELNKLPLSMLKRFAMKIFLGK